MLVADEVRLFAVEALGYNDRPCWDGLEVVLRPHPLFLTRMIDT